MVKISLYLDTRRKGKSGKFPIKIAIRHNYSSYFLPTNIDILAENWQDNKVVGLKNDKQINRMLDLRLASLNLRLANVANSVNIRSLKAKELAALLDDSVSINDGHGDKSKGITLQKGFEMFIETKHKPRTKEIYELTANKINSYCSKILKIDYSQLYLSDIDYTWLITFDKWMQDEGNRTNTRSINLRNIRAVFNEMIKRKELSADLYPFKQFTIKAEETQKRSLTIQELRSIRDYPCEAHLQKAVDIFFLSFYLAGINMVDLLGLPTMARNERLVYRRSKTGVICDLVIPQEAWTIIDKYRGKNLLLSLCENYSDYKNIVYSINDGLQRVGEISWVNVLARNGATHKKKVITPLFPKLTTYWARHTWATIAADLDIPDAVIDAALGHRSPYRMSEIYIKRNAKKVDAAIRKVIDYVNSNEVIE